MVGDSYRTLAWNNAIKKAIEPNDIVVDFGAGSGILSLFALNHGARHVYCVERKSEAQVLCKNLLEDNGYNKDHFTICASDNELLSLINKCDVVLSESIGDHLIENVSMKVFLELCQRLNPRVSLPQQMSLYLYPEILVRKTSSLEKIEKQLDISLEKLKNSDLPNDLLDTSYFEENSNTDFYWQINNFHSINKGKCIIDYFVHPLHFYNNEIKNDQIVKTLTINTNNKKSYGILFYWTAVLYDDIKITNHPSRSKNQSHSYYQRIVEIQNPELKSINTVRIKIDMNYDDKKNEDQPCKNLQIKIL